MTEDPDWVEEYYEKVNQEKNINLQRKDSFTNWALVTLLGFFAIYGQFFLTTLPPFIRIGVLVVVIILIFRFYLRSCISFADIRRQNVLRRAIEGHWIRGKPSVKRIETLIQIFDHECWSPDPLRRVLWTQLKAGFIVLFLGPVVVLIYEMINLIVQFLTLLIPLDTLLMSCAILVFLLVYLLYELISIRRYQPLQQKPQKSKKSP
ncbi:MAG: hypothetical protein ACXADB_05000 [Candidatus Hermodarchaeia archaeon]